MTNAESKARTRKRLAGPLAAIVLTAALASPAPLSANCLVDYADCVDAASELNGFWKRSAAGVDCFIDFIGCLGGRLG